MKLLLTSAAAILIAAPAYAQDKMTLLLDWFINPDHGPIIVAEELGYFADQGLEVEIIPPADPSAPPKLVAAGQGDIAVSYQPSLHLQIAEGLPLIRVGTLIATPLNCLLVLKDGPIQHISQLKGGKIGFSVAGVEEAVLTAMLSKHGVGLDEVEMVNVNFSLSPSLMSQQVDAVIGAYRNFELNQMEIEGVEGKCFYVEEEGVPTYDELIYVTNPELMDQDQVRRFLRATELATQYIVNNPEESWNLFKGYAPELDDQLNAKAWIDTLPRFALRPEALDEGRYTRFEQFLADSGLVEGTRPVSALAVDLGAE
ncbi:ABC transporter substrate-binding protein [Cognatiyoonia sp. IB215446]|uniref:ABC transporter substrate-binding protein n=1 Tax=Cognatiyoonia sp. IB215446 TaxID=3097355 RepID=UPI002A115192|nr:ABC transporter substrate-binding protein [Cognatiyoonia sp. IB215446]MDX8348603.1 ABC transporter substrate-binding protein [Cognatiyoonia sp. IB215446]